MMHRLFVLAFATFVGCAASGTTAQRVPNDLLIRYAEGGGFTGQWAGAMISADGIARTWRPRSGDSVAAIIGTIPRATIEALWKRIELDHLLDGAGGGEPGNVTRTVVVSSGNRSVEVRWPYGPGPDARTRPYADLYEQCRLAVEALKH